MKNLCFIPARSGSKSIPSKNTIEFHNKPLIAWTILTAISSGIFDTVFVSTDSAKIKEISKKYGAECDFLRPKLISRDRSLTIDAIKHAIKKFRNYNQEFDIITILQPTSPLRKVSDILKSNKIFMKNFYKIDKLISIVEVPHNFIPSSLMYFSKNGLIENYNKNNITIRQKKNKYYARNGAAIYILKTETIEEPILNGKIIPYLMNKMSSIDIDDYEDLFIAKKIFKRSNIFDV